MEIHRYGGDLELSNLNAFVRIFERVKYRWLLGLTATRKRLDGLHVIFDERCPVVDTITLEEAVAKGWVSKFIEINLIVKFSGEEQLKYKMINEKYVELYAWFQYDYRTISKVLGGEHIYVSPNEIQNGDLKLPPIGIMEEGIIRDRRGNYIRQKLSGAYYYKRDFAFYYARELNIPKEEIIAKALSCNRHMAQRKSFLYYNQTKINLVVEIVRLLNKKTMVFSESILFTDKVKELLGDRAVSYHSKVKGIKVDGKRISSTKVKEQLLRKFIENEVDTMCCGKSLDAGTDVDDVEAGIASSYTSNPTQNIQRRGRIVRLLNNGLVKNAIFINVVISGSQEEKWLKKAQQGRDNIVTLHTVESLRAFI